MVRLRGSRILVTGGSGFIGSWLIPELSRWGVEVYSVDRAHGDLSEPGVFDGKLRYISPSIVVHLAAQPGILYCEDDPLNAIRQNTEMTLLVAKACARNNARLVYASTSEVYGSNMDMGMCQEATPVGEPKNIYAMTKLWGEQVCQLYAPMGLAILRISMPFGPFQETETSPRLPRHRAAVINFLWQALHRQPIIVHRDTHRSLCWIGDTVRAIRMLIQQGKYGIWNVGRDDQLMSMYEIAKLACKLTDAPTDLIKVVDVPGPRTVAKNLSMAKIRTIGWEPRVDVEEGMRRTLSWVEKLPGP